MITATTRPTFRLSEEQSRHSYRAVVHILSPGADIAIDAPIRVHTLQITYTERAAVGLVIKAVGHVILSSGRLSKTTSDVYVPYSEAPAWLQDIVIEYAPSWSPWDITRPVES